MSRRIHLRDLRYYIFTGLLFGGINGVFAPVPKLIKNLWNGSNGLTQLWSHGPVVPYAMSSFLNRRKRAKS